MIVTFGPVSRKFKLKSIFYEGTLNFMNTCSIPTKLKVVLTSFLLLSSYAGAQLKDSNRLIVPGQSLGSLKLNMSKKEVKAKFGLADNTEVSTQWSYQGVGEDFVRIVFNGDKVSFIAFSSDQYVTAEGLKSGSAEAKFKGFKRQTHFQPGPDEKKITNVRYLAPGGGLAFYKYDIEDIEPDQRDLHHAGTVFKGAVPPEENPKDWK